MTKWEEWIHVMSRKDGGWSCCQSDVVSDNRTDGDGDEPFHEMVDCP